MNRKFVVFLAAAGVAALGAVALSARAKTPVNLAANNPGPAAVSLAKVVTVKSAPREEITGALNPARELKGGFEVAGRLARILVRKGAFVGEGQVIAQLDPELADAQVLQAEAAVKAAEAQSAMASDTAQRQTQLQQTGSVSEWQGKSANSQASAASAQLQAARAQFLLMQTRNANQMLDIWVPVLEDRSRKDMSAKAVLDAEKALEALLKTRPDDPDVWYMVAETRGLSGNITRCVSLCALKSTTAKPCTFESCTNIRAVDPSAARSNAAWKFFAPFGREPACWAMETWPSARDCHGRP